MEKLITRKNLLITNLVLFLVFILLGMKAVWPVIFKEQNTATIQQTVNNDNTGAVTTTKRAERPVYDVITKNDLFVYKGPIAVTPEKRREPYDLTKVWTLKSVLQYPDGLHALIEDKGQPDREARLPYTMYDVKVGDIIEADTAPRIFSAEIIDIQRNKVIYYRHDMDDRIDEERTFEITMW